MERQQFEVRRRVSRRGTGAAEGAGTVGRSRRMVRPSQPHVLCMQRAVSRLAHSILPSPGTSFSPEITATSLLKLMSWAH